jgi:NADPH-dependent 2,4-dienoyl-CoA reductase/sulfur reductase-like enzyme/nitrite reductase/ring-hydroxylating ferredoxin subunit
MSEHKPESPALDLEQGVPLADLSEGAPVQAAFRGEQVLLVRRGGKVFAIGGVCTHYSSALGGGIVTGDTVRCPAHHSRFSLTTGDAVCAPALNPVDVWQVEINGGRAFLKGKQARLPVRKLSGRNLPGRVVIVGAGAAGNAAAETLRREGFEGLVTVLGADPSVPYDRPNLSKDYLAGTAPEEWIPLRSAEFYGEQGISLRTGAAVAGIDTQARTVTLREGESLPYDALLLATGADPIRLSMPGSDLPHVFTLRTLTDARAIIERAKRSRRAVVLGASFIGLEVAASLRARGLDVHVIAPEAVPLERVMGAEIGAFVRGLHEEHGVVFHLGHTARAISDGTVTLDDGAALPADLVVMGVGVRPGVALAEQARLVVERGVMVDERLETGTAGVFAAGDVARYPNPATGEHVRIEHWAIAERQGQVAARNILGRRERFREVPFFWSAHYDVTISFVGHAEKWSRLAFSGSLARKDCRVEFMLDGRRLAVATVGRDRESLQAEAEMEGALTG